MYRTRYAFWLALLYLLVAGAWIMGSSEVATWFAHDVVLLRRIEEIKGLAFVIVTAGALFVGARVLFARIEQAAEELVRRERALVSNERRAFAGLMAASVAHDVNNVLMVVLSDVDELRDPQTKERAASAHARLQTSLQHLVDLNRRLVLTVRHNTNARMEPLELTAATRETVEFDRKHQALRNTTLTLDLGPPVTLLAQPVLVSQLVTNLVVNAGEATGGKGQVEVRLAATLSEVTLEVHDSGPGVPPERRATLFEALATTKTDGNGMGLFSVRACARALGGDVAVLDSPLGGACFRVTLPRAPRPTPP